MASSVFYLFPKLKSHLRGTQYGSNEGLIDAVNQYLGDQENVFYFEGVRKLKQKLAKCIALKGNFHSLVALSTKGLERFDHTLYCIKRLQ